MSNSKENPASETESGVDRTYQLIITALIFAYFEGLESGGKVASGKTVKSMECPVEYFQKYLKNIIDNEEPISKDEAMRKLQDILSKMATEYFNGWIDTDHTSHIDLTNIPITNVDLKKIAYVESSDRLS